MTCHAVQDPIHRSMHALWQHAFMHPSNHTMGQLAHCVLAAPYESFVADMNFSFLCLIMHMAFGRTSVKLELWVGLQL